MKSIEQFNFLIKLWRFEYFTRTTIGELYLPTEEENKFCWTLEDTVRPGGIKVPGETALPDTGISLAYNIGLRYSPRFKREMPVIYTSKNGDMYTVKGQGGVSFQQAQIHGGNKHEDTEGCPLVAFNRPSLETIQGTAEKKLTEIIKNYLTQGTVGLSIVNMPQRNTKFA